jgi:hypothetical protein
MKIKNLSIATIAILLFINYSMDFYRRYILESQKNEIEKLISKNEDAFELTRLMATDLDVRLKECDRLFTGLLSLNSKLLSQSEHKSAPAASTPINKSNETASRESTANSEAEISFSSMLDVPTEQMDRELKELSSDERMLVKYSGVSDPKEWDPAKIIDQLQDETNIKLEDQERQLVGFEIEAYRQACHSTYSQYAGALQLELIERIKKKDYIAAQPDGTFAEPEADKADIFAKTVLNGKLFIWKTSDYQDVSRKFTTFRYIPLVMLRNVSRHFSQGR